MTGIAFILETLDDLERRINACLAANFELSNPNADENDDARIAVNIPSHEELDAIDSAILRFSKATLGKQPSKEQWKCNAEILEESKNRHKKAEEIHQLEPWFARNTHQCQLKWIRLSRFFVREISSDTKIPGKKN